LFEHDYVKTFTDTLEQLKASASLMEETDAVITFLNSVEASPFKPTIIKPAGSMETCIQWLEV